MLLSTPNTLKEQLCFTIPIYTETVNCSSVSMIFHSMVVDNYMEEYHSTQSTSHMNNTEHVVTVNALSYTLCSYDLTLEVIKGHVMYVAGKGPTDESCQVIT